MVTNTTVMVRGDRLVVPYRPSIRDRGTGAVEISLRHTTPVRAALDAARTPIRFEDLCTKVQTDFPNAPSATVTATLTKLVTQGALVTSFHAPSTQPDAVGHLLRELEAAGEATAKQAAALREIHTLLRQHQRESLDASRAVRAEAVTRMHRLARTNRHPVAVDLRLDAEIALPDAVAREAERAAMLLTRLSPYPHGTPLWGDYHRRFYERFGAGTLVPLLELVADSGIGWPDGSPGASAAPRRPQHPRRDEALLALAQGAALDGRVEVVLDEALIAELEPTGTGPARLPSHLELCARVDATSIEALGRGDFRAPKQVILDDPARSKLPSRSGSDGATVVQAVTVIMGTVVGLTFLFGFGNVLNLALRLGVPAWVAPLVAPAVDLSILGLLLGIRHLALTGVPSAQVRSARRLLLFASVVTLALNVADPLIAGDYGKAAFDAVGPLLLIGWAEVGPDLLRALTTASRPAEAAPGEVKPVQAVCSDEPSANGQAAPESSGNARPERADKQSDQPSSRLIDDDLLERAKQEDARRWDAHRRPISADTLRRKLRIGAARSRLLVTIIRADSQRRPAQEEVTAQAGA